MIGFMILVSTAFADVAKGPIILNRGPNLQISAYDCKSDVNDVHSDDLTTACAVFKEWVVGFPMGHAFGCSFVTKCSLSVVKRDESTGRKSSVTIHGGELTVYCLPDQQPKIDGSAASYRSASAACASKGLERCMKEAFMSADESESQFIQKNVKQLFKENGSDPK